MWRYCLPNGVQIESITLLTLRLLLSLEYQDLQNKDVTIFSICICPRNTIEIQMNFYPNPDELIADNIACLN